MKTWLHRVVLGVLLSLWMLLQGLPGWAANPPQPEVAPLTVLTVEALQERLRSPIMTEGVRTLDLRRLVIDLRPENSSFREQFYRGLRSQLQRSGAPIGLDLSGSLIQGSLDASQLGLRAPLYGDALSPIFTPAEQQQLRRDRRRLIHLSQLSRSLLSDTLSPRELQLTVVRGTVKLSQTHFTGRVNFSNTFFLNPVDAQGAIFDADFDCAETRFSQSTNFAAARFAQAAEFRNSIFFGKVSFSQTYFLRLANFQASEFQATANFNRAVFQQQANFNRGQWQGNADFAQTRWQDQALFTKSQFNQAVFFTEGNFEKAVNFRETQFNQPVNLRGASLAGQVDFSYARFAKSAYVNISGLQWNPNQAVILGDPGYIGQALSVPTLQGNETLLRNLVRNFRQLEQVADANQIEYMTQKLRLQDLGRQLFSTNINQVSLARLTEIGFSEAQAAAIAQGRQERPFRSLTDLLTREVIDLATYTKVRDRATAGEPLSLGEWTLDGLYWLGLSLLLLLTRYGTSFWLIFGVGLVAIALFSLLFWGVDRWRRLRPQLIIPTLQETLCVLACSGIMLIAGVAAVMQTTEMPGLTFALLAALVFPLPLTVVWLMYQRGRYHDLMTVSYFVEDGSQRQFRLLIGRLPIVPRFPFFRERYEPILWSRRWGWLNYFDLSLNNFLKFGFNDIRLRDEHLPGWISSLIWYQWTLGLLYIALLLWTLSRTIPGLNLFIYF